MPLSKSFLAQVYFLLLFGGMLTQGCADKRNAPVLRLIGADTVTVLQGATYNDRGVIAFDREDLDISDEVRVSKPVDVNQLGYQQLVYRATDRHGNFTEIGRMVMILPSAVTQSGNYIARANGFGCTSQGNTVSISPYLGQPDKLLISPVIGTGNSTMTLNIDSDGSLSYASGSNIPCNVSIQQADGHFSVDRDSIVVILFTNAQPSPFITLVYERQ
jgi:hypothetical protein